MAIDLKPFEGWTHEESAEQHVWFGCSDGSPVMRVDKDHDHDKDGILVRTVGELLNILKLLEAISRGRQSATGWSGCEGWDIIEAGKILSRIFPGKSATQELLEAAKLLIVDCEAQDGIGERWDVKNLKKALARFINERDELVRAVEDAKKPRPDEAGCVLGVAIDPDAWDRIKAIVGRLKEERKDA